MIKLIASDMDGTLLDENSQVPEETFELIRELKKEGVHFCVSSGRRYDTLSELFGPVKHEIDYVASNGTQVYVQGECIDREVYSHAAIKRLEEVIKLFDCLHLVLFDRKNSYLLEDYHVYEREIDKDLPNAKRIYESPSPDVSIIKAGVYCSCKEHLMDMTYALTRELGDEFVFAPSGQSWIDPIQRGVNKATGIKQVMDYYGVDNSEVIAFGDAMNDYEILRMVGESRAMGNARYAIKQIAKKTIGTNVEHSVQQAMRDILEEYRSSR